MVFSIWWINGLFFTFSVSISALFQIILNDYILLLKLFGNGKENNLKDPLVKMWMNYRRVR